MKRVCLVTTSPLIVNFFLAPHLLRLSRQFHVTLVVNAAEGTALVPLPGIEIVSLGMQRSWSPLRDLLALIGLRRLFRARRFDLVHSFSPKAGLLAMLAARLAGVPRRLHTYTGQVWATSRGPSRALFKAADRCVAACATHLLADSPSQREFLIAQGIVSADRIRVLGAGSICGVDTRRFRPDDSARAAVRRELALPHDAVVVLFLGRIKKEKGIPELAEAFSIIAGRHERAHLLLVGPDEEGLWPEVERICGNHWRRVRMQGYTFEPERYVAAADVLVLPSHREGFGSVIIEAAAGGIPAVASRIYGITDALVDGETGLLHAPGDPQDLAAQLERLLTDTEMRTQLGGQARARALRDFPQERLTRLLADFYAEIA